MKELNSQYVITQDTLSALLKVDVTNQPANESYGFELEVTQYFNSVGDILTETLGQKAEVIKFSESEMNTELENKIKPELNANPNAICICLDRFLLDAFENNPKYRERFFRFSMCRTVSGGRAPRQGAFSFEQQIALLKGRINDIDLKQIVLVDDGLFSGGTIKEFLELINNNGIKLNIEKVIGFIGNTRISEDKPFPVIEIVEEISNLYDWVDVRDFGPLGGKKLAASKNNAVNTAVPYLYPWSNGEGARIDLTSNFFKASKDMIFAFQTLITNYVRLTGRSPLTFRDLVKAGFALPTNIQKTIPISINDKVNDYLNRCIETINIEENRFVEVFDMDGTLYELDGENKGFKGSSLEKAVIKNAKTFIQKNENCNGIQAEKILETALMDPVGISRYLSKRYNMTRNDYFNEVWNIDPQDIIKNFQSSIAFFKNQSDYAKRILLTSAPRIWAEQVLIFLGLKERFEEIITGDQYGTKEEIFKMLAGRYKPERILSVGDQQETDILPAQKYNLKTLQVTGPADLKLISDLNKNQ